MNTATHCFSCGKPLDQNKYIQSPNGGICQKKAWCPDCYENGHKSVTTERVSSYAERPSPKWEDKDEY